jgi:predicted peptidase
MRKIDLVLAGLWLLLLCPLAVRAAEEPTGFLNKTITANGETRSYVLYVPRDYSRAKKWPVILFLHGAGERGDDGLKQSEVGIGSAIRMDPDRFPALVVMPQCKTGKHWADEMADYALNALDETLKHYSVDKNRLYLTGLSMGGYGSWTIATLHPDMFAAVVPICGGGDPEQAAQKLKDEPIWVFHGGADPTAPVEQSHRMVDALKAAGSSVKYTEYPGVGHNSWDRAYSEKDLTDWLFAQTRAETAKTKAAK